MSKESYFSQYVSPNIVIVPTLSFLPPCKENKADPNTNSDCCEQNSVNILSKTSTSSLNSEKNIMKEADCNIAGTGTSELHYPHKKDKSLTEEQKKNTNQSIKELSSNKYISRNNLVDLTGFNIHKRDSSLTKQNGTESKQFKTDQNIEPKTITEISMLEQNMMKNNDKSENKEYLHIHTKNIKSYRETSKSEGVLNNSSREKTKENTSGRSKQDKTDMEDKMKKYFRHLWKRNIDRLKDQSDKGKQNTISKTLRTKQNCKVSRREANQTKKSKPKLEVGATQTATKRLKNKTINSSTKYSSRSKSESKSSLHSLGDREGYLSPDSITRYKKFQRFLRHIENYDDDDDNKGKTEKQNKNENSRARTKPLKSNKTIHHAEPKKLLERKLPEKSDLHNNKNLNNIDPMKSVKSVVTQVNKNLPHNYPPNKCDLRSRLSRKRTRSECFTHSQQILENKMDVEDLIITVKQDVKPDPKILAMIPPKNKPKNRKCKKIKLVINIECPTSDSDSEHSDQNVNECCTSPQDLSFLDDFDVDEIVDLLNTNHSEGENSTNASKMSQINNTNENDQMNKNNQEPKSKRRLIKPTNIKTSKISKAKSIHYEKLPGDKCWHESEIKTNSSLLKDKFSNRGETNIKKTNGKNSEGSVTAIKKSLKIVNETTNKKVDDKKNIKPLTESNTNPNKKLSRNPDGRIKKPLSTVKNAFNMKVAKSVKPSHINTTRADDLIEASLETMFKDIGQNNNIETDDAQLIISNKQANEQQITKIEDNIEASLDNMFNNIKNETAFNANNKITNTCQNTEQEKIIPTTQQMTKVTVKPHDHKADNQSKITMINKTEQHIKLEPETLQDLEAQMLLDTPKYTIEQKVSTKINSEQKKNSHENIQHKSDHLQNSNDTNKKSLEVPINTTKKTANEMHIKLHKGIENSLQKAKNTSSKSLEVVKHTKIDKQVNVTSLSRPNKNIEKGYDSKKSKDAIKKSLEKPSNSLVNNSKNKSSVSSLYPSDKQTKQKRNVTCHVTENSITEYEVNNQEDIQSFGKNENVKEKEDRQNSNESIKIKAATKNAEKKFNDKNNIEPLNINKNIKAMKKSLEKPSNSLVNNAKHKSFDSSLYPSDKQTKKQSNVTCHVTETSIAEYEVNNQVDIQTLSNPSENDKEKEERQNSNESIDIKAVNKNVEKEFNDKTNVEPLNINKNIKEAEHCEKANHTTKSSVMATNNNVTEKKVGTEMQVESLNIPNKNVNENTKQLQKSNTVTTVQEKPINTSKLPNNSEQNIDEKAENHLKTYGNKSHATKTKTNVEKEIKIQMDFELSNIPDKNCQQKAEHVINSTDTLKEQYSAKIDVNPLNKSEISIKDNAKPVQILTGISKNSQEKSIDIIKDKSNIENEIKQSKESNKTISDNLRRDDTRNNTIEAKVNNVEKTTENISNKKVETNVNNLQKTEKSVKTINDTTNNKNAGTETFLVKSVVTTKKSAPTVDKKDSMAYEKGSIKTGAKPNSEEKLERSQEKVTSNSPKPRTIDDDLLKAKDSTIKGIEKNNNSKKLDENMEANTKIKQKQVVSNDKTVSNGAEKNQEAKSYKPKSKVPLETPFVKKMEERMLIYLGKQYTVTSVVHSGRFSVIYKCKDVRGENYAVKVMGGKHLKNKGMYMETMLAQLQKYSSIRHSSILCFLKGFGVQGLWCLLTDYYPKNLEEALKEHGRSFHIELVQVLARQLIDAVIMLTNNNIIHSDIKPTHILMNNNNDRLKLCGFDRSDYIHRMHITPKTGTPSYRAPEIILGFSEGIKIDVWSTALVIFEMATNTKLFPGQFNNDILYKHICTLGSFDWEMIEYCKYKHLHFNGLSFMRRVGHKGENILLLHAFHRNKRLRKQLYTSVQTLTEWEVVENKVEKLHRLLEQMLVLDPRQRLPIQFAGASEFLQDLFT